MDKEKTKEIIRQAAKGGKVMRIGYIDQKAEYSIRNVEPYEIRDGKLWAYCRKKKGIRQFSIDQIQSAKLTKYPYLPKWPVKINESMEKKAYEKWLYKIASCFGDYEDAELE